MDTTKLYKAGDKPIIFNKLHQGRHLGMEDNDNMQNYKAPHQIGTELPGITSR